MRKLAKIGLGILGVVLLFLFGSIGMTIFLDDDKTNIQENNKDGNRIVNGSVVNIREQMDIFTLEDGVIEARHIPSQLSYDTLINDLESYNDNLVVISGLAREEGSDLRLFVENNKQDYDVVHIRLDEIVDKTGGSGYSLDDFPIKIYGRIMNEQNWRGEPVIQAKSVLIYDTWDYFDANIKLVEFDRQPLCENCVSNTMEIYPDGKYHDEDYSDAAIMGGSHDVVIFDILLTPYTVPNTKMSDLIFHLQFMYNNASYKFAPLNSHDLDYKYSQSLFESRPMEDKNLQKKWSEKCTVFSAQVVNPDIIRLCFPIPTVVDKIEKLGLFYDTFGKNQYLEISIDAGCEYAYCVTKWSIPPPNIPMNYTSLNTSKNSSNSNITYRYAITEADFYDTVYPEYSTLVKEASAKGLKYWSDLNNIKFQYVAQPELADFIITMGGTGEEVSLFGVTDTYGSVNKIGCLIDLGQECTLTLFVENTFGESIELHNHETIVFIVAHEVGHLLGFPHHSSSLHVMYGSLDATKTWYNDSDYGFVTPRVHIPDNRAIRGDAYGSELIQLPTRDEVYLEQSVGE